jgi:hypothetical protein
LLHYDELGFLRQYGDPPVGAADEIMISYAFVKLGHEPYEDAITAGYNPPFWNNAKPFLMVYSSENNIWCM